MRSRIPRIAIAIALLLTGYLIGTHTGQTIHAQTMRAEIPSYYGKVIGADSSSLWFEDNQGTLRQVTIPAGSTIFTIARQR